MTTSTAPTATRLATGGRQPRALGAGTLVLRGPPAGGADDARAGPRGRDRGEGVHRGGGRRALGPVRALEGGGADAAPPHACGALGPRHRLALVEGPGRLGGGAGGRSDAVALGVSVLGVSVLVVSVLGVRWAPTWAVFSHARSPVTYLTAARTTATASSSW